MIGIDSVISERSLDMHREYLKTLRLRYSIFEKSYPELKGKSIAEIAKSRVKDRAEALKLKCDITLHDLYFSSFGEPYQSCVSARSVFGSEASFLYELFKFCESEKSDYAIVCINRSRLGFVGGGGEVLLKIHNPILCIDLCEHAYFLDYGFDRKSYLENLLPHLDISRIDKFYNTKD